MHEHELQFHIKCKAGDMGRYCFLPGDFRDFSAVLLNIFRNFRFHLFPVGENRHGIYHPCQMLRFADGIGAVSDDCHVAAPVKKSVAHRTVADTGAFEFFQAFERRRFSLRSRCHDEHF